MGLLIILRILLLRRYRRNLGAEGLFPLRQEKHFDFKDVTRVYQICSHAFVPSSFVNSPKM